MESNTQADPRTQKAELTSPSTALQPLPLVTSVSQAESDETKRPSGVVASDYHLKFAEEAHQYVREYIRNADQKAAIFFAASTTLLAFLHQQKVAARWMKPIRQ